MTPVENGGYGCNIEDRKDGREKMKIFRRPKIDKIRKKAFFDISKRKNGDANADNLNRKEERTRVRNVF